MIRVEFPSSKLIEYNRCRMIESNIRDKLGRLNLTVSVRWAANPVSRPATVYQHASGTGGGAARYAGDDI